MKPEDYLTYNPTTGKLFWKNRTLNLCHDKASCLRFNKLFAGKEAFTLISTGKYRVGKILGKKYYAHIIIWRIVTGCWPDSEIDHIDRNPENNQWANLRVATNSQNRANRGLFKNSLSKSKGVNFHKPSGKWRARVKGNHIGIFDTKLEAVEAYNKSVVCEYGDFSVLSSV